MLNFSLTEQIGLHKNTKALSHVQLLNIYFWKKIMATYLETKPIAASLFNSIDLTEFTATFGD